MKAKEFDIEEMRSRRALQAAYHNHKESVVYVAFGFLVTILGWTSQQERPSIALALLAFAIHLFMRQQLMRRDNAATLMKAYDRAIEEDRRFTRSQRSMAEHKYPKPWNYMFPTTTQLTYRRGQYLGLPIEQAYERLLVHKAAGKVLFDEKVISWSGLALVAWIALPLLWPYLKDYMPFWS